MANMASWNGHEFKVDPKLIYTFGELSIKGASETEDKTASKQKYVSRKNSKPYEISVTVQLDARLGIGDVKSEAVKLAEEARNGKSDYFYLGGKKVVNCKFMITEASVESVEMLGNGTWIKCDVKCVWKQCGKISGSSGSGGSGSGSKKKSSKKSGKSAKDKSSSKSSGWFNSVSSSGSKSSPSYVAETIKKAKQASSKKSTSGKTTS